MSEMTTCKQCHQPMRAKGTNNMSRAFCSSRCTGDYRIAINEAKRAEREAQAEKALAHNRRVMARYIVQRRIRLARVQRMSA